MYKKALPTKTTLTVNKAYQGETIEAKMRRIKNNKEPIGDGSPLIYTEKEEGVSPEYDIRSDKFELLIEQHDKAYEQHAANRKAFQEKLEKENKGNKGNEGTGNGDTKTEGGQGEGTKE